MISFKNSLTTSLALLQVGKALGHPQKVSTKPERYLNLSTVSAKMCYWLQKVQLVTELESKISERNEEAPVRVQRWPITIRIE